MARLQVIEFWRDIYGADPNVMMDRYIYTAATDTVSLETVNIGGGGLSAFHPPAGTKVGEECDDTDFVEYFSRGDNTGVDVVVTVNAAVCCELEATDFSVVKTNNTSLLTPNGTIVITAPVLDINEYEASIDGGSNYVTQVGGEIKFENLPAGSYSIIIKTITGVCSVTVGLSILDNIVYPPPLIEETTQPPLYSPVFYPITHGYKIVDNTITIKEDGGGTYIEVASQDAKDYLATLPIIKILDNEDYAGTYQVVSVDDVDDPEKFYIDADFTTEQNALYVPYDRQVFELYGERSFNNYEKIADISVYPNGDGEYLVRVEGFLQALFQVPPPVNDGDEITLLRKYYLQPTYFEMEAAPTVYNAVYSAIPDLTDYLVPLTPLGPVPINFINEQTLKGAPVLFSYIDTTVGRIKNVTSSNQTEIVSAGPLVIINALPLNQYEVQWVNPLGAIAALNVTPALPAYITQVASPTDTVKLLIDLTQGSGGDYDAGDYDSDDYLISGPNTVVGCNDYVFKDGVTDLFTLRLCVFPIQASEQLCASDEDTFNIGWVNQEGGWSSFLFEGKKIYGKQVGNTRENKIAGVLRRSSVEDVYNTAEVTIANKSIRELLFIATLRQSIQAYLYSDATRQWSIPIILDKQNFPIYSTPFKQLEVVDKFTFKYSEEVRIQTQ